MLENVKVLLEINSEDVSKDALINLYIQRAKDFIMNYCEVDKIPFILNSTIEEMTTFSYRQKGVENINSEGKGSLTEKYLHSYPSNIMTVLDNYKHQLQRQKEYAVKFI